MRGLWKKYRQTGTTADKPRSGRPPILSLHQKHIIYRKAVAQPKIEYKELAQATRTFLRNHHVTSIANEHFYCVPTNSKYNDSSSIE